MSNSYNHNGTEFGITSGNLQAGSTPAAVAVDALTLGVVSADQIQPSGPQARVEIVFIEDNVGDIATLLQSVGTGREVHVLDSRLDGLEQMASILQGRENIDALHLISHGKEASVNLGSLMLDATSAQSHAAELKTIGGALT